MNNFNVLSIEFPRNISLKMKSSIEFSTSIASQKNMNEIRNQNWNYPRLKFNISSGLVSRDEYNDLKTFFYICQGKLNGFLIHDFTDYSIKNQIIGIGDGSTKKFQIFKNYTLKNYKFQREINFPISKTVEIFIDKIPEFSFEVEDNFIVFQDPPKKGQVIVINCSFLVPVRFDVDILSGKIGNQSNRILDEITLVEIKS